MMGDVADYGEWKTGRRASGTVTAAVVFALWAGLALGGAIAGWLFSICMASFPELTCSRRTRRSGILLTASVYAGLAFLAAAVCLFFYPISREVNQKIANELAERRKGFAPQANDIDSARFGNTASGKEESCSTNSRGLTGMLDRQSWSASLPCCTARGPRAHFSQRCVQRRFRDRRGHQRGADYGAGSAAATRSSRRNSIPSRRKMCSSGRSFIPSRTSTTSILPTSTLPSASKHHMFIVGHNLVWHNQVPRGSFTTTKAISLDRDALLARMHDHIHTVVGRYKGRIQSWDVVNEALNEDGTMRQSLWYKIIGDGLH